MMKEYTPTQCHDMDRGLPRGVGNNADYIVPTRVEYLMRRAKGVGNAITGLTTTLVDEGQADIQIRTIPPLRTVEVSDTTVKIGGGAIIDIDLQYGLNTAIENGLNGVTKDEIRQQRAAIKAYVDDLAIEANAFPNMPFGIATERTIGYDGPGVAFVLPLSMNRVVSVNDKEFFGGNLPRSEVIPNRDSSVLYGSTKAIHDALSRIIETSTQSRDPQSAIENQFRTEDVTAALNNAQYALLQVAKDRCAIRIQTINAVDTDIRFTLSREEMQNWRLITEERDNYNRPIYVINQPPGKDSVPFDGPRPPILFTADGTCITPNMFGDHLDIRWPRDMNLRGKNPLE